MYFKSERSGFFVKEVAMGEIRLQIILNKDEAEALVTISKKEFRHPRDQARYFLRGELEKQGLLPPKSPNISENQDNKHKIKIA